MGRDKKKDVGDIALKINIPGPGNYKTNTSSCNGPKYGFGTMQRPEIGGKKPTDTPGPGHYKIPCKVADLPTFAIQNKSDEFKYI